MSLVVELGDITAADEATLAAVGGKAANLGRLINAGLPVPGGFCLTTAAYAITVGSTLDEWLGGGLDPDPASAAREARRLVEDCEPSAELVEAVKVRYAALGPDVPVAVRSSATAEDLPDASFAGQQDTYLHVIGAEQVLDAIRRCWGSLWTGRAVSYRAAHDIDQRSVRLAVVVQRMVPASVAGVMFTADPISGHRSRTVIDANPGLGESVVSGAVDPDRFVTDSLSGTVLDERVGSKRTAVFGRPDGGVVTRSTDGEDAPCLTADQIRELTALGQRVQALDGVPQDIEWALAADGGLWLTQARPITTLYPQLRSTRPGDRVFLCLSLAQGLTRPITPMGQAAFRLIGSSVAAVAGHPIADPYAGPSTLVMAGMRVFADVTGLLRNRLGRRLAHAGAGAMEFRTQTVLNALFEDPRFAAEPGRPAVGSVLRVLIRARTPLRIAAGLIEPRLAYRGVARIERRLRRTLQLPATATAEQRLDHVIERLSTDVFLIMPRTFGYAVGGFLAYGIARRLLGADAGAEELQTVLRGLDHNVTTAMDLELSALARKLRSDAPSREALTRHSPADLADAFRSQTLPRPLQAGLTSFLDHYGHRAVAEIDLGMPRWRDEPDHLLNVLANYLRADEIADPQEQFAAGALAAEAMITELTERIRRRSHLRARLVNVLLRRAWALVGIRESPKFLLVLTLAALRAQLQRVGVAARDAGALHEPDDIFWLDLIEARQALTGVDHRAAVTSRREDYARELRRRHVPRLLLTDGSEPEATLRAVADPGALTGSPASVGVVTGPARVVLDPVGAHLEPGEILIAPSTDPGWTPLFLTAGGLVMEMGGSNSHGAVVAREYGIPAVVGVPEATHLISTGQQVTVDGGAGRVSVAGSVE